MFSPVENLPVYRDPGEVVISTLVKRDLAFILHLLLQDRVTRKAGEDSYQLNTYCSVRWENKNCKAGLIHTRSWLSRGSR